MDPEEQKRLQDIREQVKKLEQQETEIIANRQTTFKDGLIYAATARCAYCRTGLFYPEKQRFEPGSMAEDLRQCWVCLPVYAAALANDRAFPYDSHTVYPFNFWEVKSENQPSANGASTRPPDGPHSLAEAKR